MTRRPGLTRRVLLACASAGAAQPSAAGAAAEAGGAALPPTASDAAGPDAPTGRDATDGHRAAAPVPMTAVRLLPSPFLAATEANRAYLLRLEPDRLLHNYRAQAGLAPTGAVYGGWESQSIAGHTLGHYLSALSLLHASTGDREAHRRVASIVAELALCQGRRTDGYVGGFWRLENGVREPGHVALAEVRRGDIRSSGFDLNGLWSPFYNIHKVLAGLLDAEAFAGDADARPVAVALADYVGGVIGPLDDSQLQTVLACEYGGINESLAELHHRTGEARFLALARRFHDRLTLDPLARGVDDLGGLHANTQIPKIIGLARIAEVSAEGGGGTGSETVAVETFWAAATAHHAYVIGGVGDREYFTAPDTTADYITEQTCETCASYNLLKLARHRYAADPRAAYFDVYERTQLNHILAQHDPATGMFTYMMPLMAGAAREWSTPFDDFWCCVGTGMESHSKHVDSIYWHQGGDTLLVNLFVPSTVRWNGLALRLHNDEPGAGRVRIVVAAAAAAARTLRVRVPGWSRGTHATLNGAALDATPDGDGYLTIHRRFRAGDAIAIAFDARLRTESPARAPHLVAVFQGPLLLAADLGPAASPAPDMAPALVSSAPLAAVAAVSAGDGRFRTVGIGRPHDLVLAPFAAGRHRRAAPYLPLFTEAEWVREEAGFRAEADARRALAARTVDTLHPGEMQSERDHGLTAAVSYPVLYRGRHGRDARAGGYFAFRLRTRPGPLVLRCTYWGEERDRTFRILVDGAVLATVTLSATEPGRFVDADYPLPAGADGHRPSSVLVRIEPVGRSSAGPVFGVRLLAAVPPSPRPDAPAAASRDAPHAATL